MMLRKPQCVVCRVQCMAHEMERCGWFKAVNNYLEILRQKLSSAMIDRGLRFTNFNK